MMKIVNVTDSLYWFIGSTSIRIAEERSTVHALVELIHHCQQGLDEPGKVLRVLLLDYSKAFDRVDHTILLRKLANTGIPDFVVQWFTSFLCERRQCTKVGDTTSDWCSINGGVPQGTLFGPVGFLIHITDLQTVLDITKYVDDRGQTSSVSRVPSSWASR